MILSLLTSLIISNAGLKTGVPVIDNHTQTVKALNGTVSVNKDFPEEFYGKWVVKSTLIETNNPELFLTKSVNIWVFDRNGETITLSNPLSGATASITIDEVIGKKAKFSREKTEEDMTKTEIVQLAIEGDSFSGEDQQIYKNFYKNKIYKTDVVKYRVEGKKISGPALKDLFAK